MVTLPVGVDPLQFARRARARGADVLELRTDLHPATLDAAGLAAELALLVAERGAPIPAAWQRAAVLVDRELGTVPADASLLSHHAPAPLAPAEAEAIWQRAEPRPGVALKHVEPLGEPRDGARLLETQARLGARFGAERVTVLATGPGAQWLRALLAERNMLDYLAAGADWSAAPGQRLLSDAVRAAHATPGAARLGLLGTGIGHAASPRIHPPPFDRLELPADTDVGPLLDALHPYYRALAITSPFKRVVARHVGSSLLAVNTLVRRDTGWLAGNTDTISARRLLDTLGSAEVTVLGDGGVTSALRVAAEGRVRLDVRRRADVGAPIERPAIWTWRHGLAAPAGLRFSGAPVAIVAYGRPAAAIAREITERGGVPLPFGPRWLILQARAQRVAWGLA